MLYSKEKSESEGGVKLLIHNSVGHISEFIVQVEEMEEQLPYPGSSTTTVQETPEVWQFISS